MSDLPSWCRVGQKVVCVEFSITHLKSIDGVTYPLSAWGFKVPVRKGVYTIREIRFDEGYGWGLLLSEIDNSHELTVYGEEIAFNISHFAPLTTKTIEEDIAIFAPLLQTRKEEELV